MTKNDVKMAKLEEAGNEELLFSDSFRDHGFTRPKVNKYPNLAWYI